MTDSPVGADTPGEQLLLPCRLPGEQPGPRTTLWRRLERLGVARSSDGLAALLADVATGRPDRRGRP